MATTPATGGISSVKSASEGTTVVQEVASVRTIDLRSQPTADGATWAVFLFLFLFLTLSMTLCAAMAAARLRRARPVAATAPAEATPAKAGDTYEAEPLSYAA